MNFTLTSAWTAASGYEAARLRVDEADLEHLYLGLLTIGGSAARLLGTRGVTLASARTHVRALRPDDGLGPHTTGTAWLPPMSPQQYVDGDPEFRPTTRARELMERAEHGNTFDILVELLREPSKVVRRLVHADGIEPQTLVSDLQAGADDQEAAQKVPVIAGVLPEPARAYQVRHFLPAPPELVAEVIASDEFLPRWIFFGAEQLEGRVATLDSGLTVAQELAREQRDDTLIVDWVQRMLDSQYAGQALSYDHFQISPAPGGAEVIRDTGRRSFGFLSRLTAPVLDRKQSGHLLDYRYQLAFAVADRQAGVA
ncbi:hypothetical protein [Enemella sp. A6]|uniref:hypothetical protein n=1 Tax=Enemella sp. A6 TaxID=3440152 RepID=UPI003EC0E778